MERAGECLRLFVAGDRAKVGKSTTCLAIVGKLLTCGYKASDIAYIKPATQCTKSQLVVRFCAAVGVEAVPIGPVVFRSGFTRDFLEGNAPTSSDMLADVRSAVARLSEGRRVVVVDGVGYPAVGSICGVSNANIARAVRAPVVLVGKRGVGDAVDSYNLNAVFFEAHGVPVLGGIFNRLPADGYYSRDSCRAFVSSYFAQHRPGQRAYGFVPEDSAMEAEVQAGAVSEGVEGAAGGDPEGSGPPAETSRAADVKDWSTALTSPERLSMLGLSDADARRAAGVFRHFLGEIDAVAMLADAAAAVWPPHPGGEAPGPRGADPRTGGPDDAGDGTRDVRAAYFVRLAEGDACGRQGW